MIKNKTPILVFGATGRQGGSAVAALLKAGWPVRALLRDANRPAALALQKAGVTVVQGSFDDRAALRRAMQGAYGVFSVLPGTLSAEEEVRHGTLIADMAVEAGVTHLVYSSGASAGDVLTGVPRFDAKPRIEAHIRSLSLTTTILRPMIFMEMLVRPGFGLDQGRLVSLIRPEQAIHLTAVGDIGKFAAAIFADPTRFGGKTLKIASDRVTGHDLETAFSEASGRAIRYERFSDDVLSANADLAHMAQSLEDGPLAETIDLDAMRRIIPDLLSLRTWLSGTGQGMLRAALAPRAAVPDWK